MSSCVGLTCACWTAEDGDVVDRLGTRAQLIHVVELFKSRSTNEG